MGWTEVITGSVLRAAQYSDHGQLLHSLKLCGQGILDMGPVEERVRNLPETSNQFLLRKLPMADLPYSWRKNNTGSRDRLPG